MVVARHLHVCLACVVCAPILAAAPYNSQHIVLGRNGQIVPDADPGLYFHPRKPKTPADVTSEHEWLHHRQQQQQQQQQARADKKRRHPEHEQPWVEAEIVSLTQVILFPPKIPQDRQDATPDRRATQEQVPMASLSVRHIAIVLDETHCCEPLCDVSIEQQVVDDDEFSQLPLTQAVPVEVDDAPEISAFQRSEDLLASGMPGVQGAIVFAELSCIFVAFVTYLLHSLPLWDRFSRGQQWCLIVSFTAASLYQVAVLSWYVDLITSDIMLGLSSLIARMISLGMVPITTTSFMGRARAARENDLQLAMTSSSTTRSGRSRHPRARSGWYTAEEMKQRRKHECGLS